MEEEEEDVDSGRGWEDSDSHPPEEEDVDSGRGWEDSDSHNEDETNADISSEVNHDSSPIVNTKSEMELGEYNFGKENNNDSTANNNTKTVTFLHAQQDDPEEELFRKNKNNRQILKNYAVLNILESSFLKKEKHDS